ncbi:MAG: hypothetical protein COA94_00100 [Rickettsiales bacterium]|nr:MAG: hypothetical protein COA94_00100 [Rickettsiales bacterium]
MSDSYVDYILDLLSPYGNITAKRMFGGHGIYKDSVIIALIINEELYFKADGTNKEQYEKLGSSPFIYEAKGKPVVISYWQVPLEILEDTSKLPVWMEQSFEISLKILQEKNRKKKL